MHVNWIMEPEYTMNRCNFVFFWFISISCTVERKIVQDLFGCLSMDELYWSKYAPFVDHTFSFMLPISFTSMGKFHLTDLMLVKVAGDHSFVLRQCSIYPSHYQNAKILKVSKFIMPRSGKNGCMWPTQELAFSTGIELLQFSWQLDILNVKHLQFFLAFLGDMYLLHSLKKSLLFNYWFIRFKLLVTTVSFRCYCTLWHNV